MPHDDLLIRNAIRARCINASVEWTRQCLESVTSSNPSSSTWTDQQLVNYVYEMYLLADLRTLDPKPILPSSNSTPHKQRLFPRLGSSSKTTRPSSIGEGEGAILQILDVRDIGTSSLKMLEACESIEAAAAAAADPTEGPAAEKILPKSFLALDVTDGVRKAQAMLMTAVAGIAVDMKLGAKLRVLDVDIRHGVLQLTPQNTVLLGGEVASMNEEPRVTFIMHKMQDRLGLLPNAAATRRIPGTNAPQHAARARTPLATIQQPQPLRTIVPVNNVWKNPQAAVTAADAIPASKSTFDSALGSGSNLNSGQMSTPVAHKNISNPWRNIQPPAQPFLAEEIPNEQDDYYIQMRREEEPQWDSFDEMDVDDIKLPGTEEDNNASDADRVAISDISLTERASSSRNSSSQSRRPPPRAPQTLRETTPPRVRDWRKESPPLIATKSPAKKRAATLSLKAPRSSQLVSQDTRDRPRGEWEVGSSQPSNRNIIKRPLSDIEDDLADDLADDPFQDQTRLPSLSPILDEEDDWKPEAMDGIDPLPPQVDYELQMENLDDYKDESEDWLFRRHTSPPMEMDFMHDEDPFEQARQQAQEQQPYDYNDEDDVFVFPAVSQKRGARPELEEEDIKEISEAGYTNRRRSQSFSLLPRKVEEEDERVKEESEVEMACVKVERGEPGRMEEDELDRKIKPSQSRERSEERTLLNLSNKVAANLDSESSTRDMMELDLVCTKTEKLVDVEAEAEHAEQIEIANAEEVQVAEMSEARAPRSKEIENGMASDTEAEGTINEAGSDRVIPREDIVAAKQHQELEREWKQATGMELVPSSPLLKLPPQLETTATTTATVRTERQTSVSSDTTERKRTGGTSYHEAIDLSSDDDEDPQPASKLQPESDVTSLDIHRVIKTEPGLEDTGSKIPSLSRNSSVIIKQEETLLEFDMDDMDDFGGLKEVVIPEVELNQVLRLVCEGQEVKAKARIHKLGKFSLTTLAVSIPIFLLPATEPSLNTSEIIATRQECGATGDSSAELMEGILDQDVIEQLLDYSIAEFRKLIALKKNEEAKTAVSKLRSRLSEVRTVECRVKGLRQGVPVIRELRILSTLK